MKKILLIGSQHGNELLGEKLYLQITKKHSDIMPNVTYITGNIRARRQKARYIESDLNRSYTGESLTYEQRRANRIMRYIISNEFDLVLDLHTTTSIQPPCIIIPKITDTNNHFLQASSISKVILMNDKIAKKSLIGACPSAISIEVNENTLGSSMLDAIANDIRRYLGQSVINGKQTVYVVNKFLGKNELTDDEIVNIRNFEYCQHGFYPILVGEAAYKDNTNYLGFKAFKAYENRV